LITTPSRIQATPVVGRFGRIYITSGDKLYALDAATGSEVWNRSLGLCSASSPSVAENGVLYVGTSFTGSSFGSLQAWTPEGERLWTFEGIGAVASTATVDRAGNIYFGSNDGNVYALDATGQKLWSYAAGIKVQSSPAIAKGGAILFGAFSFSVHSVGQGRPRVANGSACTSDSACEAGLVCGLANGARFGLAATANACFAPSCANQVQDPGETDIDCGGACGSCESTCTDACTPGSLVAPKAEEVLTFASGAFIRGSRASYQVGKSKLEFAAGQLRYEDRGDGFGRLALFEGERTNRVLYSEQLNRTPQWVNSTSAARIMLTADTTAAPNGTTSADRLVAPAGGYPSPKQMLNGAQPAATLSTWLRLTSPSTYDPTNPARTRAVLVDSKGRGYSEATPWSIEQTWQRRTLGSQPSTSSLELLFSHKAAYPGDAATFPQLGAADFVTWGVQFEEGPFASSYIPTTLTTARRLADRLIYEPTLMPTWVRSGLFQFDVVPLFTSAEIRSTDEYVLVAWDGGRISLTKNASGGALQISQGTATGTRSIEWTRSTKLTITINTQARTLTVSGASSGDGSSGYPPLTIPASRLAIGALLDGTRGAFARMSELRRVIAPAVTCAPDPNQCTVSCPCASGGAGCDSNAECAAGLSCLANSGTRVGYPSNFGVCLPPKCGAPKQSECGSVEAECGLCPGAPSCTRDADCRTGQVCGSGNGDRFGTSGNVCWSPTCNDATMRERSCGNYDSLCGVCTPPAGQPPLCQPSCELKACSDGCSGTCGQACLGLVRPSWDLEEQHPLPLEVETRALGEVPVEHDVSAFGTAQITIPVHVAPGRKGMAPDLRLSYDSSNGYGLLGLGWSLDGLSQITSCSHTFPKSQRSGVEAEWGYCADGERLILLESHDNVSRPEWMDDPPASIRVDSYRTEADTFVRFDHYYLPANPSREIWVANYKDGRRASYTRSGLTNALWMIERVVDRHGNEMNYEYTGLASDHPWFPPGGPADDRIGAGPVDPPPNQPPPPTAASVIEIYPKRILYTSHAPTGLAATRSVDFEIADAPDGVSGTNVDYMYIPARPNTDPRTGVLGGGAVLFKTGKRLKKIVQRIGGEIVHEYSLGYERSSYSERDRLKSLTECAIDGGSAVCKPAVTFDWSNLTERTVRGSYTVTLTPREVAPYQHPVDLNGDGITEMMFLSLGDITTPTPRPSGQPVPTLGRTIHLLQGLPSAQQIIDTGIEVPERAMALTDVDGDGRTDIVFRTPVGTTGSRTIPFFWVPAESDSSVPGGFTYKRILQLTKWSVIPLDDGEDEGIKVELYPVDLNGDSRPELLYCGGLDEDGRHGTWRYALWARDSTTREVRYDAIIDTGFGCATPQAGSWQDWGYGVMQWQQSRDGNAGPLVVDVDRDGVAEWIWWAGLTGDNEKANGIYKLQGTEYVRWRAVRLHARNTTLSNPAEQFFLQADVNGDGYIDLISMQVPDNAPNPFTGEGVAPARPQVHINVGSGFLEPTDLIADGVEVPLLYFPSARAIDWDGDGRDEVLFVKDGQWRLFGGKQGQRFTDLGVQLPEAVVSASAITAQDLPVRPFFAFPPVISHFSRTPGQDVLFRKAGQPTWEAWARPDGQPDLVTDVHVGTQPGSAITHKFRYSDTSDPNVYGWWDVLLGRDDPRAHCFDGSAGYFPLKCMRAARTVVAGTVTATGTVEHEHTRVDYLYANGREHEQARGFMGFTAIWETRPAFDQEDVTYYDTVNLDRTTGAPYNRGYETAHLTRRNISAGTAAMTVEELRHTLSVTVARCSGASCGSRDRAAYAPFHADTQRLVTDNGKVVASTFTSTPMDALGNALGSTVLTNPSFGNADFMESEQRIVSYVPPDNTWPAGGPAPTFEVAKPQSVALTSCFAQPDVPCVSQTICSPANVCMTACVQPRTCTGRVTTYTHRPTGELWKVNQFGDGFAEVSNAELGYDAYGNVTSNTLWGRTSDALSPTNRSYSVVYTGANESEYIFPRKLVDALGHERHVAYHPLFGTQIAEEFNGVAQFAVLDGFGRVARRESNQLGLTETLDLSAGVSYPTETQSQSGAGSQVSVYDALGRVQSVQSTEFDNQLSIIDYGYNVRGQLRSVSVPHAPAVTNANAETYDYDDEGKLTRISYPDGTLKSMIYDGPKIDLTDERGNTRKFELDNGRVVKITEPVVEGVAATTKYSYGAFGALQTITDHLGNKRTTERDAWGHIVRESEPGLGTTRYEYSGYGEVLKVRPPDASGNIDLTYDALGRVTSRTSAGIASTFQWDTATNGIGALHWVDRGGIRETYAYDSAGRKSQTRYAVGDSADFVESVVERDGFGRPTLVQLPAGPGAGSLQLKYGYDDRTGRVARVDRITAAGTTLVWRLNATHVSGALKEEEFGNGLKTVWGVDPNRLLVDSITTGAGGNIQNLAIGYDAAGNVDMRTDRNRAAGALAWTERFGYDALNRLTSQEVQQGTTSRRRLGFSYDVLGSVDEKTDVVGGVQTTRVFTHTSASNPYAVTGVSGLYAAADLVYDGLGRLRKKGNLRVDYTGLDQPSRVWTENGAIAPTDYFYNAHGGLARTVQGAVTTFYAGTVEKEVNGTAVTFRYHVSNGVRAVATLVWSASGSDVTDVRYLHVDERGSVSVITGPTGLVKEQQSFGAWGDSRSADWLTPAAPGSDSFGFTGHAQRPFASYGLLGAGARLYDSELLGFWQRDPVLGDPYDPQDLNPHAYARNRPTVLVDPTGLDEQPVSPGEFGATARVRGPGGVFVSYAPPAVASMPVVPVAISTQTVGGRSYTVTGYCESCASANPPSPQDGMKVGRGGPPTNGSGGGLTPAEIDTMIKAGGMIVAEMFIPGLAIVSGIHTLVNPEASVTEKAITATTMALSLVAPAAAVALRHGGKIATLVAKLAKAKSAITNRLFGKLFAARGAPAAGRSVGTAAAQGFKSFDAFKSAMGRAGAGKEWHHVVEQTAGNVSQFGAQSIHKGSNLLRIPEAAHRQISAYYSSIRPFTNGQTVRQWLSTQSFQAQYDFGKQVISQFGGPWLGM
jgi:RHS repeat-associated protein